jgi:hypothetical protein
VVGVLGVFSVVASRLSRQRWRRLNGRSKEKRPFESWQQLEAVADRLGSV